MKRAIRLAVASAAFCVSVATLAQADPGGGNPGNTKTPIRHVIILFQENVSFDHYFGTYPNAQNNPGETPFYAQGFTPSVNGLSPDLLKNNPNKTADLTTQANPTRLSPAQAFTCSQNHNYGPEQQAVDSGLMDVFPHFTGRTTSEGCTPDGTTVLGYYDGNTVTALWNYAQNFAMSDNYFDATFGPSTPGALNLIAGQTFGGVLFFGSGSSGNAFPTTYTSGTTVVTDIGDFDPYLDDCGADAGGTVTTSATLRMTGRNVGDLLNDAHITWGWFQGGFKPTQDATFNPDGSLATPAQCKAAHSGHPGVANPVPPFVTGADIHTSVNDYVAHHAPFMMYASTSNPHHLRPTSVAAIGTTDRANHNYDSSDFLDALSGHSLPAVSFIKAPAYENGHPGNSDPTSEQNWVVSIVNQVMQSPYWHDTAIFITYDDSDGWYDHVNGPVVSPSSTSVDGLAGPGNCGKPLAGANPARCGHGPRLPLVLVSPWANPNSIDHTLTNQTSVIKFIEDNWQLGNIDGPSAPPNGQASFDRNAGTLMNLFNFDARPSTDPVLLNCNGTYLDKHQSPPATCP
jgi:phospholipase C